MHLKIRSTGRHLWTWVLLEATQLTVLEADRAFPSERQASAAALAFAELVTRAGQTLTSCRAGGLI